MKIYFLILLTTLLQISSQSPATRRRKRPSPYQEPRNRFVIRNSEDHPILEHVPDNCHHGSGGRQRRHPVMALHKFKGKGAPKCLDGSQSTFYLLRRKESRDWVIYLPGGMFCATSRTCHHFMYLMNELTTSRYLGNCRRGMGIQSTNEKNNPYFYKSNMVYIPYCSQDLWSGTNKGHRFTGSKKKLNFMGSKILEQTITLLSQKYGMKNADRIILAGNSAGGIGVLLNVDRVKKLLRFFGSSAKVFGVADSAWYLIPENHKNCTHGGTCQMVEQLKEGSEVWKPRTDARCDRKMRKYDATRGDDVTTRWKCFFAPQTFGFIDSPVYVIQSTFDKTHIQSDGFNFHYSGSSNRKKLVDYLDNLYKRMASTLKQVPSLFVPTCIGHSYIQDDLWRTVSIDNMDISDALKCWLESHEDETVVTSQPSKNMTSSFQNEDNELSRNDVMYLSSRKRRSTCKQRLFKECQIPQCNFECPRVELYGNTYTNQQFHSYIFNTKDDVCKAFCNI